MFNCLVIVSVVMTDEKPPFRGAMAIRLAELPFVPQPGNWLCFGDDPINIDRLPYERFAHKVASVTYCVDDKQFYVEIDRYEVHPGIDFDRYAAEHFGPSWKVSIDE